MVSVGVGANVKITHVNGFSCSANSLPGLSVPANAGRGIKAHLVAGPSVHVHSGSSVSGGGGGGSSSSNSSRKQSPHPSLQSPYPPQGAPFPGHSVSPPRHLRPDPVRGSTVSYFNSPSSHHMLSGTHLDPGSVVSNPLNPMGPRKSGHPAIIMPSEHVDCQIKPDKPAAPLPLRKQRTTSPPNTQVDQYYPNHQKRLPYHPTGQHRSSQSSGAPESKARSLWPSQKRHGHSENAEYAYAYGDSSNSSYVSNRVSSVDSVQFFRLSMFPLTVTLSMLSTPFAHF